MVLPIRKNKKLVNNRKISKKRLRFSRNHFIIERGRLGYQYYYTVLFCGLIRKVALINTAVGESAETGGNLREFEFKARK